MLPDASCLLPPLARHAAAAVSSSTSSSSSYSENATTTTAARPRFFGADEFAAASPLLKQNQKHFIPAAVEVAGAPVWLNAALGPGLQCFEAASLGMPLEVWKTYLGRNRGTGTLKAVGEIYRNGGVSAFWAGTGAKMVESASKGLILMYSKESLLRVFEKAHVSPGLAGTLAGAGGGACQTIVMAPMTFLVTAAVTSQPGSDSGAFAVIKRTYNAHGIKGFYPGGSAIALRQITNWASRQGFTEWARSQAGKLFHGDPKAKLSKPQEVGAGIVGGVLACWNHPIELARIEAQARANAGQPHLSISGIFSMVVREQGPAGLFKGVVPRMFLGVWQTLCMVTGAKLLQQYFEKP